MDDDSHTFRLTIVQDMTDFASLLMYTFDTQNGGETADLVIWGDILFLIDFSMDFIVLYFSLKLLSFPLKMKRLVWASVFSAATTIALIVQKSHTVFLIIISVFIVFCICLILLPYELYSVKNILRLGFVFFALEATAGGFLTICYSLIGSRIGYIFQENRDSEIKIRYFWIFTLLLSLIYYFISQCLSRPVSEKRNDTLYVTINGTAMQFPCFYDSGNIVKEPISGLPVIFVPKTDISRSLHLTKHRFRAIPVTTIEGHNLVYGFKPDTLFIRGKGNPSEINICAYLVFGAFHQKFAILPNDIPISINRNGEAI